MLWPKHYKYNNKDGDNSLNILKDKNYQASSQTKKISFISYVFSLVSVSNGRLTFMGY